VLPEIIKLIEENKEKHKLDGWNTEIANQMIEFLKPFKDVSLELQAKKTPTLHLVLIRQADLMKHCEVDTENDHTVSNTYHYYFSINNTIDPMSALRSITFILVVLGGVRSAEKGSK